jgi:hypothetical protein
MVDFSWRYVFLSFDAASITKDNECRSSVTGAPRKMPRATKCHGDGYKLHLDINDTGLPISAIVTSASPLLRCMTARLRSH